MPKKSNGTAHCRLCKKRKTKSSFWKDKSRTNGVCSICKNCYKHSEYGDEKRTYLNNYAIKYKKSDKNQIKLMARKLTWKAIRDGHLIPKPCEICNKKAEAHHPDYSNHLKITWLCDLHHRRLHVILNRKS